MKVDDVEQSVTTKDRRVVFSKSAGVWSLYSPHSVTSILAVTQCFKALFSPFFILMIGEQGVDVLFRGY